MFVFFLFAPGTLDAFLSSSWYFPAEGREGGRKERSRGVVLNYSAIAIQGLFNHGFGEYLMQF